MEDEHNIFLTQNSFNNEEIGDLNLSVDTQMAEECASNLLHDTSSQSYFFICDAEPVKKPEYEPLVSDISDDELILTCEKVEKEEKMKTASARFGEVMQDKDVEVMSKRR